MSNGAGTVDGCNPAEAWDAMRDDPTAQLVDVRTEPEWRFVGLPDLSELGREVVLQEWQSYPGMRVDPGFTDRLLDRFGGKPPGQIFFLCRSGARSMHAAMTVASACSARGIDTRCVNVEEGFEGDLDALRHRGSVSGWKARDLPWRQS